MVHGFYGCMGGFCFDFDTTSDVKFTNFGKSCPRLTLTARGVALLAKCGRLPDLEAEDIKDKSKADSLGKAVVCVQGVWMIAQVIQRGAAQYPITLLEINCVAHVLCALLIYVLWWHKPQNIKEPTRLEGDWAKTLCTYVSSSYRYVG